MIAYASQQKAIIMIDSGRFKDDRSGRSGGKGTVNTDTDEHPNRTTTMEKMAKFRPASRRMALPPATPCIMTAQLHHRHAKTR
ncbi:MAG: hypothetical protein ACLTCB_00825 [Merdibacter sp.]